MSGKLKIKMTKAQPEFQLQVLIADYLRSQYPRVLFVSSMAGMKLSMPQAVRMKRIQVDGFCVPDLAVYEPRGAWHGLFLEIKAICPFKANGELKANEHLENQFCALQRLEMRNYVAKFVWDFEMAKRLIDDYLKK